MALSHRFWLLAIVIPTLLFSSECVLAGPAPTVFYRVTNDAVPTDRFASFEDAGRASVQRKIQQGFPYKFSHMQADANWPAYWSWPYYYLVNSNGTLDGPYRWSSMVSKWWVCDPTPAIGPAYASDGQGLPKNHASSPGAYPSGCPTPEVDADSNACAGSCPPFGAPVVGNPIDVRRMAKMQVDEDYSSQGEFPLTFIRRYFSDGYSDQAFLPIRTLGERWRHNFDRTVAVYTAGSNTSAVVVRPDGRALKFTLTSGVWAPLPNIQDLLVRLVDGSGNPTGWVYTTADRTVETYNANGVLVSIASRTGIVQTLTYSDGSTSPTIAPAPGLLIGVTDSFWRSLQFTYDSNKRIVTLTNPGGGTTLFSYTSSNMLQSVSYPDSTSKSYVYGESAYMSGSPRGTHLTGIIDESGARRWVL
jgi:YD repeat-containing protein